MSLSLTIPTLLQCRKLYKYLIEYIFVILKSLMLNCLSIFYKIAINSTIM